MKANKIYDISSEQFKKIKTKYEKLMYSIAYRIGGDKVTFSIEDSLQELYISAFDACEAYGRKMDMEFDDFFDTEEFHKYMKSCLWNKKNSSGKGIQKKWGINNHASIEDEILESNANTVFEYPDVSALLMDCSLDKEEQSVVSCIMGDFKVVKPNGKVNISMLARNLNKEKKEVKKILGRLQHLFKDYE
jgi:hypothetical protein